MLTHVAQPGHGTCGVQTICFPCITRSRPKHGDRDSFKNTEHQWVRIGHPEQTTEIFIGGFHPVSWHLCRLATAAASLTTISKSHRVLDQSIFFSKQAFDPTALDFGRLELRLIAWQASSGQGAIQTSPKSKWLCFTHCFVCHTKCLPTAYSLQL